MESGRSSFSAILAGSMSSLSLFLIYRFPQPLFFLLFFVVWIATIVLTHFFLPKNNGRSPQNLWLILATCIACFALVSLVEAHLLIYFLIILCGTVVGILFRSQDIKEEGRLSYLEKPFRRMTMMLWVFDAYAMLAALFAVSLFFQNFPFWIVAFGAALVMAGASFMIWGSYYRVAIGSHLLWLLFVALLVFELVWAIQFLPFGYAVSSLVVTWLWYLIQLLLRFHFSERGIVWKKQRWFLGGNAVLLLIFFIFIFRWI